MQYYLLTIWLQLRFGLALHSTHIINRIPELSHRLPIIITLFVCNNRVYKQVCDM